uniref:F-box domain-containing protein n=1 Tax=Aegilops tauschii subsp. strangulata TaxID=200361 RepID=A0A453TD25_AEGTS
PLVSIPIPDDLLEEIFLRLPTPDAVARASAACTSFRRVIKGRAFRRRFRALHRPPLLGFMDAAGFHPAQAPHPSAPLTGALAPCAADFSFVPAVVSSASYIPRGVQADGEGPRWRPRDVRDGRVLLDWVSLHPRAMRICCYMEDGYEELAVQPQDYLREFEPVLAPNTSEDGEEEHFKVICIAKYHTKLVLFVFPSTTMQWSMVEPPISPSLEHMSCFDCVRGCFYWTEPYRWSDHLMVLDTRTMRFSTVDLLTGYHMELRGLPDQSFDRRRPNAVVLGREGTLEMFSLVRQHGSFALYHTSLQNNSQEWKLEKVIQLPRQYHDYSISTVGAAEGFLFFRGTLEDIPVENVNVDCYSMEVNTYGITKVCTKTEKYFNRTCTLPYFSFPPLLSEPTI